MKDKFILDACCGPRYMWVNKQHPNTVYMDKRIEEKGFSKYRTNLEVKPDIQADFQNMPFSDKSFKLVVFDPPHMISAGKGFHMGLAFGTLGNNWKEELKKGFDECWRVLEDYGVLIFKWNENSIKKKEILELFQKEPLFGNSVKSKIPTIWFCFMKIPKEELK